MENIYQTLDRLLNDNINNYAQKLTLLQIKKLREQDIIDAIDQPFAQFLQGQLGAYAPEGKGKDLEKFIQENKEQLAMFQTEFDQLKADVTQGHDVNVRDFTHRWIQESLRNDPFSD